MVQNNNKFEKKSVQFVNKSDTFSWSLTRMDDNNLDNTIEDMIDMDVGYDWHGCLICWSSPIWRLHWRVYITQVSSPISSSDLTKFHCSCNYHNARLLKANWIIRWVLIQEKVRVSFIPLGFISWHANLVCSLQSWLT